MKPPYPTGKLGKTGASPERLKTTTNPFKVGEKLTAKYEK